MSYRKEVRDFEREAYWTLPRIALGLVALSVVLGGVVWGLNIASQPARVISKTFDADNMIHNYEFFHDANNNVMARTAQIKGHRAIIADNKDVSEQTRLRIELAAIQQSCRDLVARYNSNATKVNRSIFMGRTAPTNINPETCE